MLPWMDREKPIPDPAWLYDYAPVLAHIELPPIAATIPHLAEAFALQERLKTEATQRVLEPPKDSRPAGDKVWDPSVLAGLIPDYKPPAPNTLPATMKIEVKG